MLPMYIVDNNLIDEEGLSILCAGIEASKSLTKFGSLTFVHFWFSIALIDYVGAI
jgi:hypothetical protein